jgi:hypothetical protein
MLKLIREGIERNFKQLSDRVLTNEYVRWRRDSTEPQAALLAACDLLWPYTSTDEISTGWSKFFCKYCGKNNSHSTRDCKKELDRRSPKPAGGATQTPEGKQDPKDKRDPDPKDKLGFDCKNCGKNRSHNTDKCRKGATDTKQKYTGKTKPDGTKGEIPRDPKYICINCKVPGHYKDWCPK